MFEGELSAQSGVLRALNQVFIKDISVFSCIQLSVFSDHFSSPCRWKTPPLLDATATMLHCWDGILQVISGAWFLSDMNKELRLIRPDNLFIHIYIFWELFGCFCKFRSGFHFSFDCSVWPGGYILKESWMFQTTSIKDYERQMLQWTSSTQQNFCVVFPRSVSTQICLSALQAIPLTSLLNFCSDIHYSY